MNFFLSLLGVIGSPSSPPGGWVRDSSYAVDDGSAAAMHVSIALLHTAEAEAALEAVFNAVSEPGNKDYGQFLSKDQITATMPPVAGAVDATLAWCTAKGFACSIVGTGDIIAAVAPQRLPSTELWAKCKCR
eukprot:gene12899-3637_t